MASLREETIGILLPISVCILPARPSFLLPILPLKNLYTLQKATLITKTALCLLQER